MNTSTITEEFTDTEFMSADEKAKVYKAWKRFLNGGCRFTQFTKALYHHLTLHCSFIAHYNRAAFYELYFMDAINKKVFFMQFNRNLGCKSVEYGGWLGWLTDERYTDINNAMVNYYMNNAR